MATVVVTTENFESTLSSGSTAVVDFWAPWCGPCRQFAPVFEQVSEQFPDVVFAKINTEEEELIAGALQISSIPTLMVVRDGIVLYMQPGALPAPALEDLVTKATQADMDDVRKQIAAGHQALTMEEVIATVRNAGSAQDSRGAANIPNFRR